MQTFFYCNYSGSVQGFRLARLTPEGLTPTSLYECKDLAFCTVDRFFSYDCFRTLWLEFQREETVVQLPQSYRGMFGVRGLTGKIEDRAGVINIAFLAEGYELEELDSYAIGILSDLSGFSNRLFSCLNIGSDIGYELDVEKFNCLVNQLKQNTDILLPFPIRVETNSSKDLLRFGVHIGSYDQAINSVCSVNFWPKKPEQVIDEKTFMRLSQKLYDNSMF